MKSLAHPALVAVLALAGCNGTQESTDNAMVTQISASAADDAAFDAAPVIENVADAITPSVTVAAVPKPAADTAAADSAPLSDAAAIEAEIRAGIGIQRVRYGQGWAWTKNGQILRTANRDGKKVAYFRDGGERPFFVQDEDRAFAYQGDRPVRQFDREGRGRAPDAEESRAATEAAQESRERRAQASRARDRAKPAPASGDRSPRPTPSPFSTDSPHRGPRDNRAFPTPTPGASPDRGRDRHDGPERR